MKKRFLLVAVLLTFLLSTLLLIRYVQAEDITWTQTNWEGGSSVSLVGNLPTTYIQEEGLSFSNGQAKLFINPDWVNDYAGWYYKKSFFVDNSSGSELINYVFPLDIPYDVNMNPNFSDLRFSQSDGTILEYWVEKFTESISAKVWIKISNLAIGSNSLNMYYGNSNATSSSDGQNVFLFFDDFVNGVSSSLWQGWNPANFYTDSGKLIVKNLTNAWNAGMYSSEIFARSNLELTMDYKWVSKNPSYDAMMMTWHDITTSVNYPAMLYGYYNDGNGSATTMPQSIYELGNSRGNTLHVWIQGQQYNVRSRMKQSGGALYQYKLSSDENWTTAYDSVFSTASARIGWAIHSGEHHFDNVRIREWIETEPTFVEWGTVSNYSSFTGTLESNVFDTSFPSDWGVLSYTFSGSSDYEVRVRTFSNQDKSDAPEWVSCGHIANDVDLSDTACVDDGDRYIQYWVKFNITNAISPILDEISFNFSASDQTAPVTNASSIELGNGATEGSWLNFEPIFTWNQGLDDFEGNGLLGYCISLNEMILSESSEMLDPAISSGKLTGLDDGVVNSSCPFIVVGESVDLSEIEGLTLVSNRKYYFSIKAVDFAGNIWNGPSAQYQDLVWFKYDNTIPLNVMYISTPNSTFGSVNDMFFSWPISGQAQATDNDSGILGWQYAINSSDSDAWRGTTYNDFLGMNYVPIGSGISTILLEESIHGNDIIVGNNTIFFRSIDNAGNVSTYVTGGINYGGAAPNFPDESVVNISPYSSDSNNFALNWPVATIGEGKTLKTYYYMINIQPPSSISTLTSNGTIYHATVHTNVPEDFLSGAVKGENTVYVVAVDNEDNYSPTNAIQGKFILDSNIPDPPLNFSISDTSIKEANLWRVALIWEEPEYTGNGNINYIIEKSLDGLSWIELGRISGNAYSDISSSSRKYFYRVATIDSSDESMNNPSYSLRLSITPEGRFNVPAGLVSKPVISDITTRQATISWSTDRNSDSKIQFGINSGQYFDSEIYNSAQTTDHILEINNLLPGTRYYVRTKWTDEDGNTGVSSEFPVETKPSPVVEDVKVDSIGLNFAIIKLSVNGASKARIIFGKTKGYGGSEEINTSSVKSEYSLMLRELEDGTEYHYKIVLTDEEGFEYDSFEDHVFSTPPRPQVSNVQVQEKKGVPSPTVEIFWESNIAVNSIVRFTHGGKTMDKVDMELSKGEHVMEISDLVADSEYQFVVEGVDAMGNRTSSSIYSFTTATDTRPPKISNVKSEGDIQSSEIQSERGRSGQLIVSWDTDEPSTSQVMYGEGTGGAGYPFSTQTDSEYRYQHVMIVSNLAPSSVYHFKVVSKDSSGNIGESGNITSITPKSTDTVLESVLSSLSRIFGFL